jgi:prophage maintenance system killer protein
LAKRQWGLLNRFGVFLRFDTAWDGNKRTAFACTYTFLAINGIAITADATSVYAFLADLYESGQFRFEALDQWLRTNSKSLL